ncbi:MAG: APC family permease, partial [Caulobacteraceae bacterium]
LFVLSAFGVREGAWFQNLVTLAKFVALALLVLAALALLPAVSSTGSGRAAGLAGGLAGGILAYQLIVGAYTGWNSPAYFAEETRDPGRAIPRSMFASVAAVAILYVAINGALVRGLPFPRLAASDLPLADLSARLIGPAGATVFTLIAIAAVASCLNGTIMLTPRIIFALARDRLFPALGSVVNRGGTPVLSLAATGLISLIFTATGSFETAFRLLGLFTVLINVVMNLALFRLRAARPDVERPFRAWLFPYAPLLALVLDLGLVGAFAWADPKGALWGALLLLGAIPVWMLMRFSRPARRGSA